MNTQAWSPSGLTGVWCAGNTLSALLSRWKWLHPQLRPCPSSARVPGPPVSSLNLRSYWCTSLPWGLQTLRAGPDFSITALLQLCKTASPGSREALCTEAAVLLMCCSVPSWPLKNARQRRVAHYILKASGAWRQRRPHRCGSNARAMRPGPPSTTAKPRAPV